MERSKIEVKNMESKNLFDPNFGKVPQIYLGRDKLVENVVESLEDGTGPYQTSMIYGMRGGRKNFPFS